MQALFLINGKKISCKRETAGYDTPMQNEYLKSYFESEGAMRKSALAAALGVSPAWITRLIGGEQFTPELALEAERVTNGKLDAGKLNATIKQARKKRAA